MITEKKLDGIRNGDRMDRQEIIETFSAALKVVRAGQEWAKCTGNDCGGATKEHWELLKDALAMFEEEK